MRAGNKITITLERRSDGGLRVYSADVPGLLLSGCDPELVMGDVWPAVQTIWYWNKTKEHISKLFHHCRITTTDQEDR